MKYAYHTSEILPGTGIHWQIVNVKTGVVMAESPDLSSNTFTHSTFDFSVGEGSSLSRLSLRYQRALGTTRIAGTLIVQSTKLEAGSQHDLSKM